MQTRNVCYTSIIQNAWARGQPVTVNGFIYRLSDGRLVRLLDPITSADNLNLSPVFRLSRG
jgi:carbonic anhydrase